MKGKNTGDETKFLGPPRNWIDAFGRQFYPSVHTHLSEGGANGQEGEATVGEILSWLKLSSELDPKRVEVYAVTAYWLRRMDKIDDSENELREGLKENPGDPQLLFDLGRLLPQSHWRAQRLGSGITQSGGFGGQGQRPQQVYHRANSCLTRSLGRNGTSYQ
jgi:hypothetical protein